MQSRNPRINVANFKLPIALAFFFGSSFVTPHHISSGALHRPNEQPGSTASRQHDEQQERSNRSRGSYASGDGGASRAVVVAMALVVSSAV